MDNQGTVILPHAQNASKPGRWQRALESPSKVSALWFGAVPIGNDSYSSEGDAYKNTQVINNAIKSAQVVHVPSGEYWVCSTIELGDRKIHFSGEGAELTIIKASKSFDTADDTHALMHVQGNKKAPRMLVEKFTLDAGRKVEAVIRIGAIDTGISWQSVLRDLQI